METGEDPADALRHPVRDGRIWRLSFGSSALICTQVAVTGFVVIFLESQRDFTAMEAGLVLAAINVSGRSRAADVRAPVGPPPGRACPR